MLFLPDIYFIIFADNAKAYFSGALPNENQNGFATRLISAYWRKVITTYWAHISLYIILNVFKQFPSGMDAKKGGGGDSITEQHICGIVVIHQYVDLILIQTETVSIEIPLRRYLRVTVFENVTFSESGWKKVMPKEFIPTKESARARWCR